MSYSRRQLYAMGEPIGDSATYRKADGGLILGSGGGGGGSSNGNSTSTNTNMTELPEWARGYAKDTLYQASQLTDINKNPYQTYDQNRIAGFSPLQEQAQQGAANMRPDASLGTGTDMATAAGMGALGTSYQGSSYGNQFKAPSDYQAGQFGNQFQAPQNLGYSANTFQANQMGPAQQVSTQSFNQPGSAADYMNPYMQNVVDIQKREAQRQSGVQGTQQQAQAAQTGALGGGRDAIMRAERERNLNQQMGDIQATGSNAAFQNAQQQFNTEQQARLAAQQANQQAGLTVGGQNLGALQQTSLANQNARNQAAQFGAGQGLQAAGLGAQYGLSGQQLGEQSRQYGAGQGLQAAGLSAQYGQGANQLNEQSKQYGAGLGLQGLQTGLQAAGQLGQLGQAQYGQQMGINQLQNQYGGQQQALAQQGLSQGYQDFLNQQNYPYKQIGFMSDLIRGLPLGQQSTAQMYQAPPSMMQNVAAAGMGAYGLSKLMAKGGQVKGYASGGELNPMNDPNRMTAAVGKLSDEQLKQIVQRPSSAAEKQAAQLELATRASEKQGLASAYNAIPTPTAAAAGGGMVAFGKGGIMHFAAGTNPYDDEDEEAGAAEDSNNQIPGTMGNAALQAQLQPLLLQAARRAANAEPFKGSNETEEQGVTREMEMINKIAGPSPYGEIQSQLSDLTSQAKDALEQGKGIAALSAMSAIVQGPNFMRALGGAGTAFADSYKGALAANQTAAMETAKMKINLANGQRAEKLGLVKDALGNYQAANKNKVDAYKAQQEANYKALRGLAYAERATQPPKPAAVAKPKPEEQAQAAFAALAADPTNLKLQREAASWEKTFGLSRPAVAAANVTQAGAAARQAPLLEKDYAQLQAQAAEKAAPIVDNLLLRDSVYRQALTNKDAAAQQARRQELLRIETERILKGTKAAPAPAPATTSISEAQFNDQWSKLQPGQSLLGPDGKTYTKR